MIDLGCSSRRCLLLRRVPEECPEEVRQLILECLDSRPSLRPSALQLVERLAAVPAGPAPPQPRRSADVVQRRGGRQAGAADAAGAGAPVAAEPAGAPVA